MQLVLILSLAWPDAKPAGAVMAAFVSLARRPCAARASTDCPDATRECNQATGSKITSTAQQLFCEGIMTVTKTQAIFQSDPRAQEMLTLEHSCLCASVLSRLEA